jgi:hypothetical protein
MLKYFLMLFPLICFATDDTNNLPFPPVAPNVFSTNEVDVLHARILLLEEKINRALQAPRENTVPQKALSDVASSHYDLVNKVAQLEQTVVNTLGTSGTNKPITSSSKFVAICPFCQTKNVKSKNITSNGNAVKDNGTEIFWKITYKCPKCKEMFFDYQNSFVKKVQSKLEQ